jgi:hypothetical protein
LASPPLLLFGAPFSVRCRPLRSLRAII